MFKNINFAGFGLPRLSQTKSAVALGCWFAVLTLTHSLLLGGVSWAVNKINAWRMKKQLEKMQTEMAEANLGEEQAA